MYKKLLLTATFVSVFAVSSPVFSSNQDEVTVGCWPKFTKSVKLVVSKIFNPNTLRATQDIFDHTVDFVDLVTKGVQEDGKFDMVDFASILTHVKVNLGGYSEDIKGLVTGLKTGELSDKELLEGLKKVTTMIADNDYLNRYLEENSGDQNVAALLKMKSTALAIMKAYNGKSLKKGSRINPEKAIKKVDKVYLTKFMETLDEISDKQKV